MCVRTCVYVSRNEPQQLEDYFLPADVPSEKLVKKVVIVLQGYHVTLKVRSDQKIQKSSNVITQTFIDVINGSYSSVKTASVLQLL
jgi:hypothetical protein